MPAPDDDLTLLVEAAHRAGEIARRHFGRNPRVFDKGVDGPVTEADYAIDRMLRETLRAERPGYGWLSEETEDDAARLGAECVFVCDPIDGTREFIDGGRSFAHSLAVVRNGKPVAGVVYLPMREKLYAAVHGGGATLNAEALRVTATDRLGDATVLTTKATLLPDHWPRGVPDFERAYRPSLAYRMSLVGEGRFDAMLTLRPTWEWDIAAGALIIAEAGGRVTDGQGVALAFNNPVPQVSGVIAGSAGVHGELVKARG